MKQTEETSILCPVNGQIIALKNVDDPMFQEEMLGTTYCILPDSDTIYAPFDAVVTALYPSNHAIGLRRNDGLEMLIHIGIDTAMLQGAGFTAHVAQEAHVRRNEPLLTFDSQFMKAKGYTTQTFIVFTNSKNYHITSILPNEKLKIKDVICYAEKI